MDDVHVPRRRFVVVATDQEAALLALERHGSGEPRVLVHGVTHRRQAWYQRAHRLVEHRSMG